MNPIPSRTSYEAIAIGIAPVSPEDVQAIGIPVGAEGDLPDLLGKTRDDLAALDFKAKVGRALRLPQANGPTLVAVGIGEPGELDAAKLREAAAAFGSASARYETLAFRLDGLAGVPDETAAQVVVEGILLARYRYDALKSEPDTVTLKALTLVAGAERAPALEEGARRGKTLAAAAALARDLANTPPAYLTARHIAEIAEEIAPECGLGIQVFDEKALAEMGCGGLLGVNRGSAEPPRMIVLTYTPDASDDEPVKAGHLAMVGKGVMYDSGGISLKPSNAMHAIMKVDMSGAGAVLAAMTALKALECPNRVTAYLVCTDNMPSGTAMALGDVLTIHGGKTVEVINTDAEGRLIMADAMVLATEAGVDAIVDIATLTGAALAALGPMTAAVFGNNEAFVDQVLAAAKASDEAAWELPLDQRYRKWLDSDVADIKNLGGEFAGAIIGALFLEEFVGDTPWAHIDIAGTAHTSTDEPWRPKGATGYGARLLVELAVNFTTGDG